MITSTRLYSIWSGMKQRCSNPNSSSFKYYGGRGIGVCKEWRDFATFYAWAVRAGYNAALTIDRKDNNGNYEPRNCRWVTRAQNSFNRRYAQFSNGVALNPPTYPRAVTDADWIRSRIYIARKGLELFRAIRCERNPKNLNLCALAAQEEHRYLIRYNQLYRSLEKAAAAELKAAKVQKRAAA